MYDRRIGISRTLLLNAVCEKKLDFLRLLLEHGFVSFPPDIAQFVFQNISFLVSELTPLPKMMVLLVRLSVQWSTNLTKR